MVFGTKPYDERAVFLIECFAALALIGDSWANEAMRVGLGASHLQRFPGATSAEIAERLDVNSLRSEGIEAAVIVAGVNDSARRVGRDAYAKGMESLIHKVKTAGAQPFVVELPRYGIGNRPWTRLTPMRWLRRWINDGGKIDNIQLYRDALDHETIGFDAFDGDYKDSAHLTDESSRTFGQYLSEKICFKT